MSNWRLPKFYILSHFFIAELCFQRLTVGKLYAGLLILENYRAKKSGAEVGLFFA